MFSINPVKKAEIDKGAAKAEKIAALEALTIKTASGKVFDADKAARDALTTAVAAGSVGMTTPWKLADNSVISLSYEEIKEALMLVGQAHTAIITGP